MAREHDVDAAAADMIFAAENDAVGPTLAEFLNYFCDFISSRGLKPWGRVGHRYLAAAVRQLVEAGAYDSLHVCDSCRRSFLMRSDKHTVSVFVQQYREVVDWSDFCRCNACGGTVEKTG